MQKIILYSNNCPKCNILKKKLDSLNINYEVCDDTDLMIEKGFNSAPMLEIDSNILDFSSAIKWISERG